MAEPVGITGTAVGIVSFGLQLYTGISNYLDAVKGRDEDLQQAKQHANAFQASLKAIGEIVPKVKGDYTTAKDIVEECKRSCEAELEALEALLKDLQGPLVPPDDPIAKIKGSMRKWSYPFKKNNITRLEERLESMNSILKTTLLTLQLTILDEQDKAILKLQKSVDTIQATTESTSRVMLQQSGALQHVNQTLTQSHQEIQLISQRASTHSDPRIDEILTHLRDTPNTRLQFAQLVAYQQDLKTLCDAVLRPQIRTTVHGFRKSNTNSVLSPSRQEFCRCTKRRDLRHNEGRFGLLFFETELEKTIHHAPECTLSQIVSSTQQKRSAIGLSIPSIARILKSAVRFSMSLTTGAGGLSLAQNIIWVATVDEKSSPSFKIVSTFVDLKMRSPPSRFVVEDFHTIAKSCMRRLELCYANRQASRSDVNEYGESVLDLFAWELSRMPWERYVEPVDDVAYIFRSLAAMKVPVNHNTTRGDSQYRNSQPFLSLVAENYWLIYNMRVPETISALLTCCDNLINYNYISVIDLPSHKLYMLKEFPEVSQNLGFNLLSIAILKGNEQEVGCLSKNFPSYQLEVNYCGQTPIHIAIQIGNPRLALLLLEDINSEALNIADNMQNYPIDYAFAIHEQKDIEQPCDTCRLVERLLELGSVLFERSLRVGLNTPCQRTRMAIVQHIARRRRELGQLAVSKLSAAEVRDLDVCRGWILDQYAAQAQYYLTVRSVDIPKHLMVCERNLLTEFLKSSTSIFAYITDRETAVYAHSLGFSRKTAFLVLFHRMLWSIAYSKHLNLSPSYIYWTINDGSSEGADIAAVVPSNFVSGVVAPATWAHYLMKILGAETRRDTRRDNMRDGVFPPSVADVTMSEALGDKCQCHCSLQGCTPLMRFLEGFGLRHGYFRYSFVLESDVMSLPRILEALLPDREIAQSWVPSAVVRYLTFSALELRHTCCDLRTNGQDSVLDPEEVDEIHEEDSAMLQRLEDLVDHFDIECDSMTDFSSFLGYVWLPKMREVCQEIESQELTEKELKEAEDCGVKWTSSESDVSWVEDDFGPEDLEGWMRRLDEIAIDPQRPMLGDPESSNSRIEAEFWL